MFFARLGTRGRAIVTTLITAILLFIIISPVYKSVHEFLTGPATVANIEVIQKSREVSLTWGPNRETDVVGYVIFVDNSERQNIDRSVNTTIISDLQSNKSYSIAISAKDTQGNLSGRQTFNVTLSDKINSFKVNEIDTSSEAVVYILANSVLIIGILFVMNLWVLFFNVKKTALLTIGAYPSIAILPYLILTISILLTINNNLNKFIFSAAIAIGYALLSYLLILTANILNGSLQISLPLEQAAKASQFVFSLISSYLMMIFILGANLNIVLRIVYLLPFIFYFSYSGIWFLKGLAKDQVLIKATTITLIMGVTVIVLSIWPVPNVYSILATAIVYYVLLNIGLENRAKLGKNFWIEYSILFGLILILLFTNAIWGINRTLL